MSRARSGCCLGPVLALLVMGILGAVAVTHIDSVEGKAWAVTYGASTSGNKPMAVTYQDTEGRYFWEDTSLKAHTEQGADTHWSREVMLAAKRTAKVTVTPAPGEKAHCRILLDGRKELKESSSPSPGRPAVCTADISG